MDVITYKNGKTLCLATVLKCASTTALHAAYYPLLSIQAGGREFINNQALKFNPRTMKLTDFPYRIAVIRDPVDRLVSAYGNRFLGAREHLGFRLNNPKIKTFLDFVINLKYIESHLRDVRYHTMPIYESLRHSYPSATNYTHIIDSKNINTEFVPLIKEISGVDIPLLHLNPTPLDQKKYCNIYIKKAIPLIKEIYKKDYEEYGRYFT